MSKKVLISLILSALVLFVAGCSIKLVDEGSNSANNTISQFTQESGQQVASDWVRYNAPTFVFDGSNLAFQQSTSLKCSHAWLYEFKFDSVSSGYGNRAGTAPDSVLTNHIIQVVVKSGQVTAAVADNQYDELNAKVGTAIDIEAMEQSCQQ